MKLRGPGLWHVLVELSLPRIPLYSTERSKSTMCLSSMPLRDRPMSPPFPGQMVDMENGVSWLSNDLDESALMSSP